MTEVYILQNRVFRVSIFFFMCSEKCFSLIKIHEKKSKHVTLLNTYILRCVGCIY